MSGVPLNVAEYRDGTGETHRDTGVLARRIWVSVPRFPGVCSRRAKWWCGEDEIGGGGGGEVDWAFLVQVFGEGVGV